jgi:hypothetical protein
VTIKPSYPANLGKFLFMHRGQAYFSSLPGVDIHSRVTSQASYSPEYITPTQKKIQEKKGLWGYQQVRASF